MPVPILRTVAFSLLFGLAVQASASTNLAKLRGNIASHEWRQGVADCDSLPDQESGRSDRGKSLPSHYAELAALCAVESGAGDDQAADWWWFTAMAMDSKTALGLLPELRSQGLLTRLSPPRNPVEVVVKKGENPQVLLPTGEEVEGERVKGLAPSQAPRWFGAIHKIIIELIVDSDGIARQPLLISKAVLRVDPRSIFLTFAFLRQWHFSPAKVAGQPTAAVYVLVVNPSPGG
jgi:hypothetical protein